MAVVGLRTGTNAFVFSDARGPPEVREPRANGPANADTRDDGRVAKRPSGEKAPSCALYAPGPTGELGLCGEKSGLAA